MSDEAKVCGSNALQVRSRERIVHAIEVSELLNTGDKEQAHRQSTYVKSSAACQSSQTLACKAGTKKSEMENVGAAAKVAPESLESLALRVEDSTAAVFAATAG